MSNDSNTPNLPLSPEKEAKVTAQAAGRDILTGKKTDIQHPELWTFPMDYPMSIIGHEGEHARLLDELKAILGSQFPDFDLGSIAIKPSKTGRFHSARVNLYLTHAEQVNTLYAALDNASTVRLVI